METIVDPPKKRGRGRPKGVKNGEGEPFKEIDYKLVAALCQAQCTEYEIAIALGFSEAGFSRRKKRDNFLRETLNTNYSSGKISLRRAQFRKAMDRFLTICKDCGKISHGEFLTACAYCGAENVEHKFVPGDTTMLIWLGKQVLRQSDKVDVGGNKENPIEVNLAIETSQQRLARYKKYFESLNNEPARVPPDISGRNDSGQPLLQTKTNAQTD
jgi:ribosomal protein L32